MVVIRVSNTGIITLARPCRACTERLLSKGRWLTKIGYQLSVIWSLENEEFSETINLAVDPGRLESVGGTRPSWSSGDKRRVNKNHCHPDFYLTIKRRFVLLFFNDEKHEERRKKIPPAIENSAGTGATFLLGIVAGATQKNKEGLGTGTKAPGCWPNGSCLVAYFTVIYNGVADDGRHHLLVKDKRWLPSDKLIRVRNIKGFAQSLPK